MVGDGITDLEAVQVTTPWEGTCSPAGLVWLMALLLP
jgi:hypothetical protein